MAFVPETLTIDGAERLAAKIRKYWQAKGKRVTIRIEQAGMLKNSPIYGIRSDLINGLPQ